MCEQKQPPPCSLLRSPFSVSVCVCDHSAAPAYVTVVCPHSQNFQSRQSNIVFIFCICSYTWQTVMTQEAILILKDPIDLPVCDSNNILPIAQFFLHALAPHVLEGFR